jgi:hypothetical protein
MSPNRILTYMSRTQLLKKALKEETLFKLKPLPFPGDVTVLLEDDDLSRKVYASFDVMDAVKPRHGADPFPDTREGRRLGEFRAWLDDFMLGSEISVCEGPDLKPPKTDLARVKPVEDEFWSIRVREPKDTDGLRSIGAFHDQDEFIALRWQYREVIADKFEDEVDEAKLTWADIFGTVKPHKGMCLDEYITGVVAHKTRRR